MDLTKINVEVDTETLSTNPNAVCISIGAVKFDENGIKDEFFINVNPTIGKQLGMHISEDTLNWWKSQKEGVLQQSLKNAVSPEEAFKKFSEWYGPKSLHTWANGSMFDIPILESYFRALNMKYPWKYWDVKCHRTIVSFLDPNKEHLPESTGDLHNALVDAKLQSEHLISLWKELNGS